ncbi:hypothetical protein PU634_10460 [Oceanimonas pelagia]|uniref:Uncharacterized protein n=1 Tax=Oceanimonas pelagia TaxID=3028314 RepID=A0AA50KL58_9GAMM|nr:hypothetical protein [Oceanimonas pelagia]WMC09538.1 hypothetical protein PU634_10460 [Oceanimonas pelagia]
MSNINWPRMSNDDLGTQLRYLYDRLNNEGLVSDDELDALEEAYLRLEEIPDDEEE